MARLRKSPTGYIGQKINHWTILRLHTPSNSLAQCRCDCGRVKEMTALRNVLEGLSKRCRHCSLSISRTTHGASDRLGVRPAHRLYRIWKAMKWRCNPRNRTDDRRMYYEAGVRVCDQWIHDYPAFRDWAMSNGYRDDLTIDRWPDQAGNYEPSNCRWSDGVIQARNTKANRFLTAFRETKTVAEWSEDSRCSVTEKALRRRLQIGWDSTQAITAPKMPGGHHFNHAK